VSPPPLTFSSGCQSDGAVIEWLVREVAMGGRYLDLRADLPTRVIESTAGSGPGVGQGSSPCP
jgi:hypothetical protein